MSSQYAPQSSFRMVDAQILTKALSQTHRYGAACKGIVDRPTPTRKLRATLWIAPSQPRQNGWAVTKVPFSIRRRWLKLP